MGMEDRGIMDAEGGVFDESLTRDDKYVEGWAIAATDEPMWDLEGCRPRRSKGSVYGERGRYEGILAKTPRYVDEG
jgi:hypothetical protein